MCISNVHMTVSVNCDLIFKRNTFEAVYTNKK